MPKRLTYEFVRAEFEHRGYELLTTTYINSQTRMPYRCLKHPNKETKICYSHLAQGKGCPYCAGNIQPSIEKVRSKFAECDIELLDDHYVGAHALMHCRCFKHPDKIIMISYVQLRFGRRCVLCSSLARRELQLQKAHVEFSRMGYELLEKQYINNHSLMRYRCPKHPDKETKITLYDLMGGHGCPYCKNLGKRSDAEVRQEFLDAGYVLLTKQYINSRQRLEYRCPQHPDNTLWTIYTRFYRGVRCPLCALDRNASMGVIYIKQYLLAREIDFQMEYKFDDCKNVFKLPFDFAIFDGIQFIGLIEYDGIHHYKAIAYWGGEKSLNDGQKRDKLKNDYCKSRKIPLLRIPFWETANIGEKIDRWLFDLDRYKQRQKIS